MSQTPHLNYFAQTDFRGKKTSFGIKSEDRAKHIYVIGKTGMGKSTLLENLAVQDIKNGEGMAFIDPHGKSADLLLDYVPKERINDVVYFAPFDLDNPISFNIMEDVGPDQRHLVADGLMATFKKIWQDAWSARMEYILNNTLLALLEYPDATLLGVNRMLSDKVYRKKVVDNITDPSVKSFWVDEFANYTDRFAAEATPAIQNKIGQFTNNPLIRNIIGQSKSSFNLRQLMDEKKILIVNLSKGLVGEQNTELLGGMLVTKIYLAAMSRANVQDEKLKKLPSFYLYVDEFQSFANESFADILSEARKYKLSLTIAHQYVEQMPEEVRNAVFGNVGTTIVFRVGPFDAEVLETIFMPMFTKEDLVNLGFAQIYLTLMIDGVGSRPFSATTLPPIVNLETSHKAEIIKNSQKTYGRERKVVETNIFKWVGDGRADNTKIQDTKSANNNSSVKSAIEKKVAVTPKSAIVPPPANNLKSNSESKQSSPVVEKKNEVVPTPMKTVSLRDLARRVMTPKPKLEEDRSALRNALKDLVKDQAETNKPKAINQEVKMVKPNATSDFKEVKIDNHNREDVKEVPESVLRRMFDLPSDHK